MKIIQNIRDYIVKAKTLIIANKGLVIGIAAFVVFAIIGGLHVYNPSKIDDQPHVVEHDLTLFEQMSEGLDRLSQMQKFVLVTALPASAFAYRFSSTSLPVPQNQITVSYLIECTSPSRLQAFFFSYYSKLTIFAVLSAIVLRVCTTNTVRLVSQKEKHIFDRQTGKEVTAPKEKQEEGVTQSAPAGATQPPAEQVSQAVPVGALTPLGKTRIEFNPPAAADVAKNRASNVILNMDMDSHDQVEQFKKVPHVEFNEDTFVWSRSEISRNEVANTPGFKGSFFYFARLFRFLPATLCFYAMRLQMVFNKIFIDTTRFFAVVVTSWFYVILSTLILCYTARYCGLIPIFVSWPIQKMWSALYALWNNIWNTLEILETQHCFVNGQLVSSTVIRRNCVRYPWSDLPGTQI